MTWLRLKPDFVKYNYMKCMKKEIKQILKVSVKTVEFF